MENMNFLVRPWGHRSQRPPCDPHYTRWFVREARLAIEFLPRIGRQEQRGLARRLVMAWSKAQAGAGNSGVASNIQVADDLIKTSNPQI